MWTQIYLAFSNDMYMLLSAMVKRERLSHMRSKITSSLDVQSKLQLAENIIDSCVLCPDGVNTKFHSELMRKRKL